MLRKLLLTLAATTAALLTAEGVIRLLGAAPEVGLVQVGRYRLSANPKLGFEPIPGYVSAGAVDPLNDFAGAANSLGFRDVERAAGRPAGERRIVVLGDSVGAGLKVARVEDIFPARLEARLRERGFPAEVVNLSVVGYNTQQEVETLAEKGLAFRPDLVLVAYTLSDRELLDGNILETLLARRRAAPGAAGADRRLLASALYRFFTFRVAGLGARRSSAALPPGDAAAIAAISGDTVEASFAKLARLAREHRFEVLVAVFPYFVHLTRGYSYQAEHALVRRRARRQGFEVVDLLRSMQECRWASGERIQADSFHPNELGHRCAAETLARAVERLWRRRPEPVPEHVLAARPITRRTRRS